ncbi:TPA: zinc ribbon domain-containing protein [Legionella pneumophila]|nr:zinc ribbon domain-containing protein [Legionella pneumophila]HAU1321936.1 zinc ribbon domain-containing protein [Legionella pneumophila]HBC0466431.1 zinc ribbon domain-containing protein [Legionella pneumophila]HBD9375551.1 zinc ribbon domain-containing protein [Legionella pneumophila]HBI2947569.1 zinc ribbon domain-containing protein [Legionella pneumophila]
MPIYEYQCTNCHHQFDLMQKVTDAPVKQCPKCYENTVTKLISPAGFQLKGTGWYATDFKNKGNGPKESTDSKSGESGINKESSSKETPASSSEDSAKSTKGDNE